MDYEYRVIPAPKRLRKIKGVSDTTELFAQTLTECINAEARQGWEYVRAETLSAQEPGGFLRRGSVVEETMLIFRRQRRGAPMGAEPVEQDAGLSPIGRAEPAQRGRAPLGTRTDDPRETRIQRPVPGASTPPLLRPVPRHNPGDKS